MLNFSALITGQLCFGQMLVNGLFLPVYRKAMSNFADVFEMIVSVLI